MWQLILTLSFHSDSFDETSWKKRIVALAFLYLLIFFTFNILLIFYKLAIATQESYVRFHFQSICNYKKTYVTKSNFLLIDGPMKILLKIVKLFLYDTFVGRIIMRAETTVCVMPIFLTTDVNFVVCKISNYFMWSGKY